jgi:hypothetical protein
MQLVVVHLGRHLDGKFHSHWSKGLRHPSGNKVLRFRKKKSVDTPFKESWISIWREDYDDISTSQWLEAMLKDGVLQDLLIRVDVPVPTPEHRQRIVDLAQRKLELIRGTKELPLQQLSTCDWPTPCVHRGHCHAQQGPSPAYGFVQLGA